MVVASHLAFCSSSLGKILSLVLDIVADNHQQLDSAASSSAPTAVSAMNSADEDGSTAGCNCTIESTLVLMDPCKKALVRRATLFLDTGEPKTHR